MADSPIYLDAHATTPLDPRVLDAMLPYLRERFGNAASRNHAYGWRAEEAVENAREQVAKAVGASAKEIAFTSGATEANNLAVLGAAEANTDRGRHVVTSSIEHPAVLDPCRQLEKCGFTVTCLPVDAAGRIDPDDLRRALTAETCLVSIMWANNEVGTVQDIEALARVVRDHSSALFHTDAVQAVGRVPIGLASLELDLLSLSGHKVYGPQGVGALWTRRRPRVRVQPQQFGGGHERGLRSGTHNVAGIVGLGAAMEIAEQEREADAARLGAWRDSLWAKLRAELPDVQLNGPSLPAGPLPADPPPAAAAAADHATAGATLTRLPHNLNVSFPGVEAEDLLHQLPELALSTGAACSSASLEPSHVIQALGHGDARAQTSVRIGLTRMLKEDDVQRAGDLLVAAVKRLSGRAAGGGGPRSARGNGPTGNLDKGDA